MSQGDSLMHAEKESPQNTSWPFRSEEYYEFDTDEKNRNTDDSKSDNDDFVINLYKEQDYKEDD